MTNLPKDPLAAMNEMLAAGDQITNHIAKASRLSSNPQERELFIGLLEQIRIQKQELEATLPAVFADAKSRLQNALKKREVLDSKRKEALAKAESLSARIDEAIASGRENAKEAASKPKAPIPRPKYRKLPQNASMDFSSGDTLRDWLCLAPPSPKSHPFHHPGNIWEDWGKLETPPPFEEDDESDE